MSQKTAKEYYPKSAKEWRTWLEQNHEKEQSVWVIFYKKHTGKPTMTWSEAVDEALCFGWIDSTRNAIDDEKFRQFFSQRKPKSTWSKINKDKVAELIIDKRMTPAGMRLIDLAKENGSWTFLEPVDNMIVPEDLKAAFKANLQAQKMYDQLSDSNKKSILYWLISAKREETRQKRITQIIDAAHNIETFLAVSITLLLLNILPQ